MAEFVNIYGERMTVGSVVQCTTRASMQGHREWGVVEAVNTRMQELAVRDLDGHVAWFPSEVMRPRPGYDAAGFRESARIIAAAAKTHAEDAQHGRGALKVEDRVAGRREYRPAGTGEGHGGEAAGGARPGRVDGSMVPGPPAGRAVRPERQGDLAVRAADVGVDAGAGAGYYLA